MRNILLALVLLAGCSGDDPDTCSVFTTDGELYICIEYAERVADPQENCESAGGAFASGTCDGGAVALCASLAGDTHYYQPYFDLGVTIEVARMACEDSGGEFTEL